MGARKGQKKRFWSDEEKRSICEQTLTPGVSVAQVARRYSMNANLIFKWLKDDRFSPLAAGDDAAPVCGEFLPIEVEGLAPAVGSHNAPVSARRVDITLSDGRRILVEGSTALSSVLALVEGLMT